MKSEIERVSDPPFARGEEPDKNRYSSPEQNNGEHSYPFAAVFAILIG
jgi:hypothetical protein